MGAERSPAETWQAEAVLGAIILVVAMLLGIVGILMSGGAFAALLGTFLKDDAEQRHEGSELVDLNI